MSVKILDSLYNANTERVMLDHKGLTELPESIVRLVNLRVLELSNNKITLLPESIAELVNLETLFLNSNLLSILPESIGKLINLKGLFLNNNLLTVLPESIGKLSNLQYLDLYYNQLNSLPKSFLNIKKSLRINVDAYEIDNLSPDADFLMFSYLDKELTNLPVGLKEIWIDKQKENLNHKLPFGCEIKYF
jgi:Leucine-rich repeat (LRR) protein